MYQGMLTACWILFFQIIFAKNIIFLMIEMRSWILHIRYTQRVCPIERSTNSSPPQSPPPSLPSFPLTMKMKPMPKKGRFFNFFVEKNLNIEFQLQLVELHFFISSSSNLSKHSNCFDVLENILVDWRMSWFLNLP